MLQTLYLVKFYCFIDSCLVIHINLKVIIVVLGGSDVLYTVIYDLVQDNANNKKNCLQVGRIGWISSQLRENSGFVFLTKF